MFLARVHILGSGTCFPAGNGKARAHPGFLVVYGRKPNQRLLLDCSANIAERLKELNIDADEISQVAISHAHPDHFALPHFIQTAHCSFMGRKGFSKDGDPRDWQRLSVFAPEQIVNDLPLLNRVYFPECGESGLPFPVVTVTNMTLYRATRLEGGAILCSASVYHGFGKVDALAFRLSLPDNNGTVVYSGDTGYCEALVRIAENAELFICDCSAQVGDELTAEKYGHLNPRQAAEIARLANVKVLVLTHYSGRDSDDEMMKSARSSEYDGKIIIAKDGMILTI